MIITWDETEDGDDDERRRTTTWGYTLLKSCKWSAQIESHYTLIFILKHNLLLRGRHRCRLLKSPNRVNFLINLLLAPRQSDRISFWSDAHVAFTFTSITQCVLRVRNTTIAMQVDSSTAVACAEVVLHAFYLYLYAQVPVQEFNGKLFRYNFEFVSVRTPYCILPALGWTK